MPRPKTHKQWLDNQTPKSMTCRDYGHLWLPDTVHRIKNGFTRTLFCNNCGTLRSQQLTLTGEIVKTRLSYDPSYLRPKGAGRMSSKDKAAIRRRVILDQLKGPTP